jgi:hypothetical protein
MCKTCGCGKAPYNKKNDDPQDKKTTKGLSPKEKAEFKAKDKSHKKVKTMGADLKEDKKIVKDIKAKRKKK